MFHDCSVAIAAVHQARLTVVASGIGGLGEAAGTEVPSLGRLSLPFPWPPLAPLALAASRFPSLGRRLSLPLPWQPLASLALAASRFSLPFVASQRGRFCACACVGVSLGGRVPVWRSRDHVPPSLLPHLSRVHVPPSPSRALATQPPRSPLDVHVQTAAKYTAFHDLVARHSEMQAQAQTLQESAEAWHKHMMWDKEMAHKLEGLRSLLSSLSSLSSLVRRSTGSPLSLFFWSSRVTLDS